MEYLILESQIEQIQPQESTDSAHNLLIFFFFFILGTGNWSDGNNACYVLGIPLTIVCIVSHLIHTRLCAEYYSYSDLRDE